MGPQTKDMKRAMNVGMRALHTVQSNPTVDPLTYQAALQRDVVAIMDGLKEAGFKIVLDGPKS